MKKNKHNSLTIYIGKDMDADIEELFSGKPLKEISQPENCLYLDSYEQLNRLLSPAKINLLQYLMQTQNKTKPKSMSQVAKGLKRHQEAISRDITYLKGHGLVELKKSKQKVYAMPAYARIDIRIG